MKASFAIGLLAISSVIGWGADHPAASLRESLRRNGRPATVRASENPPSFSAPPAYCKRKRCLHYSGDFDPNNTGAVGVCFINNSSLVACETVINVKPDATSVVTGAT